MILNGEVLCIFDCHLNVNYFDAMAMMKVGALSSEGLESF
jgi:hypothetical protein